MSTSILEIYTAAMLVDNTSPHLPQFPLPMMTQDPLFPSLLTFLQPPRRRLAGGNQESYNQTSDSIGVTHTLLERISSPEGQDLPPSPQSSLLGFKGSVRYPTQSPMPSQIEEDLAYFPASPPNSNIIHHNITEVTVPLLNQIAGTITLC
jgi:hypothetical protein